MSVTMSKVKALPSTCNWLGFKIHVKRNEGKKREINVRAARYVRTLCWRDDRLFSPPSVHLKQHRKNFIPQLTNGIINWGSSESHVIDVARKNCRSCTKTWKINKQRCYHVRVNYFPSDNERLNSLFLSSQIYYLHLKISRLRCNTNYPY